MTIDTLKQAAQALRDTKPELAAALEAMAEQKPVAWRYTTARGNYRYRGPSETFAQEYKILKPFPLYAAPIATPEHDAKVMDAQDAEIKRLRELVSEMADNSTYETEYDGRMYSICHGCGAQDGEPHRSQTCVYLRAEAALKSTGADHE